MLSRLSQSQRLMIIIGISFSFFLAEISVGFYTHSLALVADAFHYMNDLVGFIVALVALRVWFSSKRANLSFGWQRAKLLGAFFNGVFLLALGVSIFLQSIERFVSLQKVNNPKLILIMGCVGLCLNIICAIFLHEHDEQSEAGNATEAEANDAMELSQREEASIPCNWAQYLEVTASRLKGHDLGMMGVLIHVIGDAANNVGVIIAALVIWLATFEGRYYADPGVSMGTAILILLSALPLVKNSGSILLESVPVGVNLEDIKHDLEKIPGVASVHELHAWRLSQNKALASAHVVTSDGSLANFMDQARLINQCLHAYGIHSATLQPELVSSARVSVSGEPSAILRQRPGTGSGCRITCGTLCEDLTCCG